MRPLLEVGIFVVSVVAGLLLGGLVPERIPPRSWRLPIGAFLLGAGIALALIVLS